MSYVINNAETKEIKSALKKFSHSIPIENQYVKGEVSISRYRKYSYREEIEVQFSGFIKVKLGRTGLDWYSLEQIKSTNNVSKIKLNRFLKKACFSEVSRRCKYFSVEIKHWNNITKILWKS